MIGLNDKILRVLDGKKIDLTKREIFEFSNNRVLYYVLLHSNKTKLTNYYLNLANVWINKLKNTLRFVRDFFGKHDIPYLVVKTYKDIPYVTFDVDVLVNERDFSRVVDLLKRDGFYFEKHPGKQSLKQLNCLRHDLLKIDLHKGFYWQGKTFFDERLIWKELKSVFILGVKVNIPSNFIEVLLNLAHILHERRYVTLLDYLFLESALKRVSVDKLITQADKYSWGGSLRSLLGIIKSISKNFVNVKFPVVLPFKLCINTFFERYHYTGYLPKFDLFYYFFTTFRYYVTGKKRLPYYKHWFLIN